MNTKHLKSHHFKTNHTFIRNLSNALSIIVSRTSIFILIYQQSMNQDGTLLGGTCPELYICDPCASHQNNSRLLQAGCQHALLKKILFITDKTHINIMCY